MATDLVPPFPDDAFRRVLCVVAHPDDVEYGISSAVASWTARGVDVAYLLLTRGEAGMDSSPPERTAQLRTEEQIAGSLAVGVSEVEFLDYPDGVLEYGLGMRRDAMRGDLLAHRRQRLGAARANRHRRARRGTGQCDRPADSATAAGDHRPFARKVDFHVTRSCGIFPMMAAVAAAAQCHRAAVTDGDACFNQRDNALSSSS